MRRRLWILTTLLLLALAAVPRPAAAGEHAAVRPVKAAPSTLAAFWEGLRHLPFLSSLRKHLTTVCRKKALRPHKTTRKARGLICVSIRRRIRDHKARRVGSTRSTWLRLWK